MHLDQIISVFIVEVSSHTTDLSVNAKSLFSVKNLSKRFRYLANIPLVIETNYFSNLTKDNQKYGRTGCQSLHYYETIEINLITSGIYTFESDNYEILYGYLYQDYFNPLNPMQNLLLQNYRGCSTFDFKLVSYLHSNITYILLVTTFLKNKTDRFTIFAYGPEEIIFNRTSKYS